MIGRLMSTILHHSTRVIYLLLFHCKLSCTIGNTNGKTDDLPDSPIEALNKCDSSLFPNISTLLRIMSRIPAISCEAERTFSALSRLKPFLRTTMGENRLSSLTLLHVHRNIEIDLEDAVDRYARLHTRKLQFL